LKVKKKMEFIHHRWLDQLTSFFSINFLDLLLIMVFKSIKSGVDGFDATID